MFYFFEASKYIRFFEIVNCPLILLSLRFGGKRFAPHQHPSVLAARFLHYQEGILQ
jgi:uncharacterized membrane-anchored protein YitT (DUF2179 family)